MQGGLLLRQRQGIVVFFSLTSGSSSLTLACRERGAFSRASAAGRSGAEPHPTATQAITKASQRTVPTGTTTKTLGQLAARPVPPKKLATLEIFAGAAD